ncbi:uncharacterized protein LOC133715002 [Rosa rugosa]|uniref:uncharacterized protein LOC133715002 n=1 Tax=Rosa rugosa TaxID=74645 RepID=UPI002B4164D8|nr:uncharacterized protein LOC133715002 [Rosa rugosa]
MEFSVCHKNAQYLCYSNPICKTKRPSTLPCQISPRRNVSRTSWGLRTPASSLMQQRVHDHRRSAVVVGCANKGCSTGMAGEIERELEAEMRPEEGAEWLGVGRLRDKCGEGRGGAVELLECLEREAIMGEDEGKEPNDYNRRAQIFYKSARVFQALRESASNE